MLRKVQSRQAIFFLVKCGVTVALLTWALQGVPLGSLLDLSTEVHQGIFWASALLMVWIYWLNSQQMQMTTAHLGLTLQTLQIFVIHLITRFYELFLPSWLASGAMRWYLYARPDQRPAAALAAIVVNRLLEMLLLLLIGLVCWSLDDTPVAAPQWLDPSLLILTGLTLLFYPLSTNGRFLALLQQISQSLLRLDRLRQPVDRLLESLREFSSVTLIWHWKVLALALLRHVLTVLSWWMLVLALSLDISVFTLGWLRTVVTLAMLLPITVSGFGVRELTLVTLLGLYGVSAAEALIFSLLTYARGVLFALVGGCLEFRRGTLSRSTHR